MCECCHSCSLCDSYAKRRCSSCSSTHLCEPSCVRSCCRHHRWTCPCCCRKYFRSHSVCGLFPSRKCSNSDEFKFYERHLTGHYLKMKSSSVTDLYNSYDLSQNSSAKPKRRSSLCSSIKRCRKSRRDTLCNEAILRCSPHILQRLDVDYDSYKSLVEVPLTYCPRRHWSQYQHNYHMGESYHDYLECLKRSIYSFKDKTNGTSELVGHSFLRDLNKLYASVGGGMEHKHTQKDPNVLIETQTPYPNPIEAMHEYRCFFDKGHPPRRYSHTRRSHSYRRRSYTPTRDSTVNVDFPYYNWPSHSYRRRSHTPTRDSMVNVDFPYYNWPMYNPRKYGYHDYNRERPSKSTQKTSLEYADFVLKYPTRLRPSARARLSLDSDERKAMMGSLLSDRSTKNTINFDFYVTRHTIHTPR